MSWREHTHWYRDTEGNLMCGTCKSDVFGGLCDCYEPEAGDATDEDHAS